LIPSCYILPHTNITLSQSGKLWNFNCSTLKPENNYPKLNNYSPTVENNTLTMTGSQLTVESNTLTLTGSQLTVGNNTLTTTGSQLTGDFYYIPLNLPGKRLWIRGLPNRGAILRAFGWDVW
jgi:hypothetical protein